MATTSAGLLLFRHRDGKREVFLVHPGGPFWARKDRHAWSIPKGEPDRDEPLLEAARREFREETGRDPDRLSGGADPLPLTPHKQSGGKIVHAWAIEGDHDPAETRSNDFTMKWPPHSGETRRFPEIDRAAWFDFGTARRKINKSQIPFLDELEAHLAG